MKVLHVSTSDTEGGAARAAYRLHQALLNSGVDSRMEVVLRNTRLPTIRGDQRILSRMRCLAKARMFELVAQFDGSPSLSIKSLGVGGSDLASRLEKAQRSIVNLHWINGEVLSIDQIGSISGPCVWTLHDCWPFSGINHYPLPAGIGERYPFLTRRRSPSFDLDRWVKTRKLKAWGAKRFAVAPSRWIRGAALASEVAKEWDIAVIPNPIPLERYVVLPRECARSYFGLRPEAFVLIYSGTVGSQVPIKGWSQLEDALGYLAKRTRGRDLQLLVIGEESTAVQTIHGIEVRYSGRLHDDAAIALAYSASDLALVPSLLDNLPQVATEAIALGVPVISFDQGGMSDIVYDGLTGFLVPPYDCDYFSKIIADLIGDFETLRRMSDAARSFAKINWSGEVVAKRYLDFYQAVLSQHGSH